MSKHIRPILVACLLLACVATVYGQMKLTNVSTATTGLTSLTGSTGAGVTQPCCSALGQLSIDTTGTGKADSVGYLYDYNLNGVPDTLVVPLAREIDIQSTADSASTASPPAPARLYPPLKANAVDFHIAIDGLNETTLGLYVDEDNNGKVDTILLPLGDNVGTTVKSAGGVVTLVSNELYGLWKPAKRAK